MPLYKDPLTSIVESVNRLNKMTLTVSDYDFSPPVAIEPTEEGINTTLTISARAGNPSYTSSVEVGYHRIDLAELLEQVNISAPVSDPLTTLDVALAINRYYGTVFTEDDIVVRDLTEVEKTLPSTVTLEAKSTSYGWIGSVTVDVRLGGLMLPDYLTTVNLDGLNYPHPSTTRPYAYLYSYWRDFSSQQALLSTVQPGTGQLAAIRDALVAVTGDAWVLTGASRYSLDQASVSIVADTTLTDDFNTAYENAIEVVLHHNYALGLSGNLVLHFNNPIE